MSLTKCRVCSVEISKKAKVCPNCGDPVPKRTSFVTWGVLLIVALSVIGGLNFNGEVVKESSKKLTEKQKFEVQERVEQSFQNELVVKAKKSVSNLMKSPSSTKFKNVFFNETSKGGAVVCGNYSSKNSLGAYSDFNRFISNGATTYIEERDKKIADLWVDVCLKEDLKTN